MKYSLLQNALPQAYLVYAIKYNPENKGTTYSTEINYPIWKDLFCNFAKTILRKLKIIFLPVFYTKLAVREKFFCKTHTQKFYRKILKIIVSTYLLQEYNISSDQEP